VLVYACEWVDVGREGCEGRVSWAIVWLASARRGSLC
jgi:hypothetical protein